MMQCLQPFTPSLLVPVYFFTFVPTKAKKNTAVQTDRRPDAVDRQTHRHWTDTGQCIADRQTDAGHFSADRQTFWTLTVV